MKRFVRILTAVLLLCLLVGCVWEDGGGEGSFTFAVTHSDGTVKESLISPQRERRWRRHCRLRDW